MIQRLYRRLGSRRGNAMVEFALASSVLIPIFIGTFQFGYTFYAYNILATQMRSGARFASMKAFQCESGDTNYKQKVRNVVRYGNPSGTGTVPEPGLTDAQVIVKIRGANGADATTTNTPTYVEAYTSGYVIDSLFTTYTFTNKPYVRMPYLGTYQPTLSESAP